jgi:hypothetical protein
MEAREAVMAVLDKNLAALHTVEPPLQPSVFQSRASTLVKETFASYDRALFQATDSAAKAELAKLRDSAEKTRGQAEKDNIARIRQFLKLAVDRVSADTSQAMEAHAALAPLASKKLKELLAKERAAGMAKFEKQLSNMHYGPEEEMGRKDLASNVELAEFRATSKNNEALKQLYVQSGEKAREAFHEVMKGLVMEVSDHGCPLFATLDQRRKEATKAAGAAFEEALEVAKDEEDANKEKSAALERLPFPEYLENARECVKQLGQKHAMTHLNRYSKFWQDQEPRTNPRDEYDLKPMLKDKAGIALKGFNEAMQPFQVEEYREAVNGERKRMQGHLVEREERVREDNTAGWKDLFEYPLSRAWDLCKECIRTGLQNKHWFSWHMRSRVRRQCRDHATNKIKEAQTSMPKKPSQTTLDNVVEAWLESKEVKKSLEALRCGWLGFIVAIICVLGTCFFFCLQGQTSSTHYQTVHYHAPPIPAGMGRGIQ